jgi:hypothetical protein
LRPPRPGSTTPGPSNRPTPSSSRANRLHNLSSMESGNDNPSDEVPPLEWDNLGHE